MYRVFIFNNSSCGGWVIAAECKTRSEAVAIADKYKAKGYDTTVEAI